MITLIYASKKLAHGLRRWNMPLGIEFISSRCRPQRDLLGLQRILWASMALSYDNEWMAYSKRWRVVGQVQKSEGQDNSWVGSPNSTPYKCILNVCVFKRRGFHNKAEHYFTFM